MVFALVGDSTTTRAPLPPPLAFGVAFLARGVPLGFSSDVGDSGDSGSGVSGVTLRFLAGTYQPFFNDEDRHLYHPAPLCASLTTSAATCAGVFRSVSIFSCANSYEGS